MELLNRRQTVQRKTSRSGTVRSYYDFKKHPYGCSQLGKDHQNTREILADAVNHPNAGGVLVFGLGL